jgi:hypothetical protein
MGDFIRTMLIAENAEGLIKTSRGFSKPSVEAARSLGKSIGVRTVGIRLISQFEFLLPYSF